jgi:radical SAM superfamily enzyme YgiQ (UPF0313 family)
LEALHKTTGLDHARQALRILRGRFPQVFTVGSFIYGLPGDTPANVCALHRLALELELDKAFFIPLTPLPGTPYWRPEDWDPTGRRFRSHSFLPAGHGLGLDPRLERALLLSWLLSWPLSRVRSYVHGLTRGDARKRRMTWRLFARSTAFALGRIWSAARGSAADSGLIFPRWYES